MKASLSPIGRKRKLKQTRLWSSSPRKPNKKLEYTEIDFEDFDLSEAYTERNLKSSSVAKINTVQDGGTPAQNMVSPVESDNFSDITLSEDEYSACHQMNNEEQFIPEMNSKNASSLSNQGENSLKEMNSFLECMNEDFNETHFEKMTQYSDSENDSDYIDGDDDKFTKTRLRNKKLRKKERNKCFLKNHQKPENLDFISSMKDYMKNETISTKNLDNSTINKTLSHLFYQEDSFLNFHIEADNNFSLENLRQFESETFQMLKFPLDWLTSTVKHDGIKE